MMHRPGHAAGMVIAGRGIELSGGGTGHFADYLNPSSWYPWPHLSGPAEPSFQDPSDENFLTTIPRLFSRAGTITYLGVRATGAGFRLALYSNDTESGLLIPKTRLWYSGVNSQVGDVDEIAVDLHVDAGDWIWAAAQAQVNGAFSSSCWPDNSVYPILGVAYTPGVNPTLGRSGYKPALAFASEPPATWNLGSADYLTSDTPTSAVMFKFEAD